MKIREATDSDLDAVLLVEREAFGGPDEAELTRALLGDPTAEPRLSLLAFEDDRPVGHVLFTAAHVDGSPDAGPVAILAPLAVVPEMQRRGVGGALISEGLRRLAKAGTTLVFVLGHPEYYPRHGFMPAAPHGLDAPYPIPREVADAWMVQELVPGSLGEAQGTVVCAETMDRPEYWSE